MKLKITQSNQVEDELRKFIKTSLFFLIINKIRSLNFNTILQNKLINSIFEQAYFKNLNFLSSLILVKKLV